MKRCQWTLLQSCVVLGAMVLSSAGASAAPVRIEAGGTANFTDHSGNVWIADTGFTGGGVVDRGNIAIANTLDPRIYQTEHYGATAFAYTVANGLYQVNLHFAETYAGITGPGQRVFSVNVEGMPINNIDVFAEAGGARKALIKMVIVSVTDGQLNMTFTPIANNPEINGIEIIPSGTTPTPTATDSGPTATPTPTPSGGVTTCAQRGVINAGEYFIQNNEWNSNSPQCITWTGGTAWSVTTANFNFTAPGVPATYPSIYKGCHWQNVPECTPNSGLPLKVSTLTSVRSSWSTIQPAGAYDVAYDIWTNSAPTTNHQPDGTEVMIWIHAQGGPIPFGPKLANVNIAGYNWNVYGANMPSWKVISYQLNPGRTSVTDLDVLAIMKDAVNRGWMRSSDYLIDGEAGFEIWKGGKGLATTFFSFDAASGPTGTPTNTATPTRTPTPTATPTATQAPTATATPCATCFRARIEAGGKVNFTDHSGNLWLADTGFTGGGLVDRGNIAITNTLDPRLYQTEHYGMTAFSYPVPTGTYQVNLHFAETYAGITGPGQRVFSVNVEGTAINNLDVYAEAGGRNIALVKTATVFVQDGQLNVTFSASVNNAEINGIEILATVLTP